MQLIVKVLIAAATLIDRIPKFGHIITTCRTNCLGAHVKDVCGTVQKRNDTVIGEIFWGEAWFLIV